MFTNPTRSDRIGRCPDCATAITSVDVLIEYGTLVGKCLYAERSHCSGVVHSE